MGCPAALELVRPLDLDLNVALGGTGVGSAVLDLLRRRRFLLLFLLPLCFRSRERLLELLLPFFFFFAFSADFCEPPCIAAP